MQTQPLTSDDRPEPLLCDGQGNILIPTLLYRLMYHREPYAGRIVRYKGGGWFTNARDEVIQVDYDFLKGIILLEAAEGFDAQTLPTARIPCNMSET
ncbi:MAG: hypothetical protein Q8Q57_12475 [Methylotenera sp.]|nr:hypothetical protein [Methylotenera sp.]